MELKKNPEVEVGRNSSLYFAIGLCLMLLFTWRTLEYKSYKTIIKPIEVVSYDSFYEEEIPITTVKTPTPPGTQIAITSDAINIVDDFKEVEETFIGTSETNQMDVMGKVTESGSTQTILKVGDIRVEDVEEDIEVPFAVIESVPVFPGCEKGTKEERRICFQNKMLEHVKDNFKYPKLAQEMGIYGRVIVLFVIDKEGRVINIQSRGPDKILEKEAERIIGLLPKMIPGKQRGKPVKVPYSVPIYFKYVER